MSKQRVGLLNQMRTKLTLDEEDLFMGNRKEGEEEERLNKVEPRQKSEGGKADQLPEGSPPKTLETLLLSDTW